MFISTSFCYVKNYSSYNGTRDTCESSEDEPTKPLPEKAKICVLASHVDQALFRVTVPCEDVVDVIYRLKKPVLLIFGECHA